MVEHLNYFDTSCLVKRYILEAGSRLIAERFDKADLIATSNLTFAEIYATIFRLCRDGYLDREGKQRILERFGDDWKIMSVIPLQDEILGLIPALIAKSPVTGADAIHLATVASLLAKGLPCLFVCSDTRLVNAAKAHRIKTYNPLE